MSQPPTKNTFENREECQQIYDAHTALVETDAFTAAELCEHGLRKNEDCPMCIGDKEPVDEKYKGWTDLSNMAATWRAQATRILELETKIKELTNAQNSRS